MCIFKIIENEETNLLSNIIMEHNFEVMVLSQKYV